MISVFLSLVSGFLLIRRAFYQRLGEGFAGLDSLLAQVLAFFPKTRKSHPLSKLLRPWFEHQRMRGVVGLNLVASLILVGLAGSPVSANFPFVSSVSSLPEPSLAYSQPMVTTQRRFQMPFAPTGVSQGFHRFHPGVDLQAPLATSIRPLASGVVVEVFQSRFGYGTALVVTHADGYASLYAHLGRVFVEKGSDVDQESVIAEVGISGTTTGPHLHLEIRKDGIPINPEIFLNYEELRS